VTAAVAPEPILGHAQPRLRIVPKQEAVCVVCGTSERRKDRCAGHAAVAFYRKMTGRAVLDWQENAVVAAMGERYVEDPYDTVHGGRWKWSAANVGLIVARQNGKGDVLLIIELYHLYILKARRIFHTAQLQKTATDAFKRMSEVVKGSPKLLAEVNGGERGIRSGKGDERIVLKDGREILFFTRSDNAGRGLFGDLLICDEAYDLTDAELAALRPMIKTAPSAQLIYASTPVDGDTMLNGLELASTRKKALAGAERMCWLEWSVPERQMDPVTGRFVNKIDERLDDPFMWAMANPSLGKRIADGRVLLELEAIGDDRNGMGVRKFMVEDLCVPDFWPDPDEDEGEDIPFDPEDFHKAARGVLPMLDPVVLGIHRSPGQEPTCLTAAGWYEDGTWGSQTVFHQPGTEWVIPRLLKIIEQHKPAVLVIDSAGPAGALVAKLQAAGLEPIVTGAAEMGRACQAIVDDFQAGRYVPSGVDEPLNRAIEIARWRFIGTSKTTRGFTAEGYGDTSALVAAALAGLGLSLHVAFGKKKAPGATLAAEPVPSSSGAADWAPGSAGALSGVGF
jgi:hypothetical protein